MKIKCLVILGLAGTMIAQEAAEHSPEVVIRALERQWTEAQAHNDNRSLDLLFDNALVYVEYGKLVSKSEYLSRIRQETPENEVLMEAMNVHASRTTTIVVGSYREKQRKRGQTVVLHWRFIDTWVYKKNEWKLVAAGATPILQ